MASSSNGLSGNTGTLNRTMAPFSAGYPISMSSGKLLIVFAPNCNSV